MCGARPNGCPYKAWDDPLIIEIISLYNACTVGDAVNIMSARAANPPYIVWQGLQWYAMAMSEARGAYMDRMKARRQRKGR